MNEAVIRTEDLNPEEITNLFVETDIDREIIDSLKGKQPILLVGSRGTGKTMLMKMAEKEISDNFGTDRILPVFVNLSSCNLHNESNILNVMISRTLISLKKSLRDHGFIIKGQLFRRHDNVELNPIVKKLEDYINSTTQVAEETDDDSDVIIDDESIRTDVDLLKDFLLELCEQFDINSIIFLFDEACHVFRPAQQRIFFNFFRSLREYYIVCKAAVYPGISSFGSFQAFHDATIKKVERSISSENYASKMREIVKNNFPSIYSTLTQHGDLLDNIIYFSSGNPRLLIKSLNEILNENGKFQQSRVNTIMKQFYGVTIWSEHTKLSEMYPGHTNMIDWARTFIEDSVLPNINKLNDEEDEKKTIYFLISRKAPEVIKQAIKTLEYSGIVSVQTEGVKRRADMYDRYELNLGIVVLSEKQPAIAKRGQEIANNLFVKKAAEYGVNSPSYPDYGNLVDLTQQNDEDNTIIDSIISQNIDVLDLSDNMKDKLHEYNFDTINDILSKDEEALRIIPYVGVVRSRKISNLVYNAILEYISG